MRSLGLCFLLSVACVGNDDSVQPGNDSGTDATTDVVVTPDATTDTGADASTKPQWTVALTARTTLAAMVVEPTTGDVYVGGSVKGAAPELSITSTQANTEDILLVKIEGTTGKILWAQTYGGAGDESVNGLALSAGGLIATGSTFGSSMGFPGASTGATLSFPSTTVTAALATQSFIAKFDTNSGTPLWAVTPDANEVAGTAHRSLCGPIATGTQIYVACDYVGSKFGPSPFAPTAGGLAGQTAVLVSNSLGSLTQLKAFFGSNIPTLVEHMVDSGGILYATGATGTTLIDQTASTNVTTAPNTVANGFVIKFAESGGTVSGMMLAGGSTGANFVESTDLVLVGSNIVVSGRYGGTPTFATLPASQGSSDGMIVSVPQAFGAITFATSFGGNDEDDMFSIASDGTNLWVAGRYLSTNMMFGTTSLSNTVSGSYQGFIGKASNVGVPISALPVVSSTGNASVQLVRTDDTHGRILGVGTYSGAVTFDDATKAQSTADAAGFIMRR